MFVSTPQEYLDDFPNDFTQRSYSRPLIGDLYDGQRVYIISIQIAKSTRESTFQ